MVTSLLIEAYAAINAIAKLAFHEEGNKRRLVTAA
jgi:hypothetical protein